jgi:hypothetical protein
MNCDEIKKLLSEYVDGVLDEKTKALVEAHLSTCRDCKEELASLKRLVNELGSLESVAPPRDFLNQLHERMEQRSWFSKILRAMFVPMRLKIPLEFAGAAAMAILVFSLFYIQQDHYRMAEAPVGLKQEGVAEKGALESWGEGLKDEASRPQPAYRAATAEQPPGKKEPIELALVMKRARPPETYAPGAAMEAAPAPKEKMRRSLAKKEAVPGAQPEADKRDDDLLPQLTGVIELVGGKVVSIEYEKASNRPESIHVEIPAEHLNTFYNRLGELGNLKSTPRSLTGKEQGLLLVRIRLLSSSR